jgi:hypothetical protein
MSLLLLLCGCWLQGSFGAVYLGTWQGNTVAVKVMNLPTSFLEDDKGTAAQQQQHEPQQQRPERNMEAPPPHYAIIEAVLSSMMSHPNIVQVGSQAWLLSRVWQYAFCSCCSKARPAVARSDALSDAAVQHVLR